MPKEKYITIENILEHVYNSGLKDGKRQVTRGWQYHYDLLINPQIKEAERDFVNELNKKP